MKKVLTTILVAMLAITLALLGACQKDEVSVKEISVKAAPTVTSKQGETFAVGNDGKLTVAYSDGSSKEVAITLSMIDVSAIDVNSTAEQTAKVTYEGKTATFKFTLTAAPVSKPTVTSIEVKTAPTVTSKQGETFAIADDGKLTVKYSDNSTDEVAITLSMIDVETIDANSTAEQTATVTYEGKTATFNFTLEAAVKAEISSIEVTKAPTVTGILTGSDFAIADNGKLTVNYDDETSEEIAITLSMIDVSAIDVNSTAEQTATVTYEGKTATFSFKLIDSLSKNAANWVAYSPSVKVGSAAVATRINLDGVKATNYKIAAGTTEVVLEHEAKNDYNTGKYQVRIPTVKGNPTYVELHVKNNGTNHVDFTFQRHSDSLSKVNVSLDGGKADTVLLAVSAGDVIGDWYQILFDQALAEDSDITIYGYIYIGNFEIGDLAVANESELTLSYKEGDTLDLSNLILSAKIKNSKGEYLADGTEVENYYIASGYVVSGVSESLTKGTHTVTVSVCGQSITIDVVVSEHDHVVEPVAKQDSTCTEEGYEAHYKCTVEGCGLLFSDAEGKTIIEAPAVIAPGHNVTLSDTAKEPTCSKCGAKPSNWVFYNVTTNVGSNSVSNGTITFDEVNGMQGTKVHVGAGTTAGSKFQLSMGSNVSGRQSEIPNLGENYNAGEVRTVLLYYVNYSDEAITVSLENDNSHEKGIVTIPAKGTAVCKFNVTNVNGSNWFYLNVESNVESDVDFGVYGYIYINDSEVSKVSLNSNSSQRVEYKVGDTFSSKGLVLDVTVPSNNTKTVYAQTGYTTDLDGRTFTSEDLGTKIVTVTFAGKTVTYEVVVNDHDHVLELVAKKDSTCTVKGHEAYYKCTIEGCTALFADATGATSIDAPVEIAFSHEATLVEPYKYPTCSKCNAKLSNWVFYNLTVQTSGVTVKNGKIEQATVNEMPGTKVHVGANTTKGSYFQLCMNGNDADRQTVIPNLSSQHKTGELRHVILYYVNYSNENITVNLQNDNGGGNGSVTIPANGTAICQFDIKNVGGSNWFYLYIDSDVTNDVDFGVYGFFYINDSELSELTINSAATKVKYKVGETFSSEGLVLNATLPSSTTKQVYAQTGYTTDLDGYTFTAEDVGTKTVTVTLSGKTVTYEITVTE